MNYSFTSLGRFLACPRQYLLATMGFREAPTVPLQFGSLVHKAAERMVKAKLRGDTPDIEAIVKGALHKYALLEESHVSEAVDMLRTWYGAFDPTLYDEVATEVRTLIHISPEVTVVTKRDFKGVSKANPGVVHVFDWKTGWKNDPDPYTPQVAMYLWATQEEYPGKSVEGYLWWLRYKREPRTLVDVDPEEGKAWALDVIGRIREAEQQPGDMGFPATPGAACKNCGVSWACVGGTLPEELTCEEDAKDVAAFALQLDSALNLCKEALKRYLKDKRSLEVGGEYWGNYPRISWKFKDLRTFTELLESNGFDPLDYLTVDSGKMDKLLSGRLREPILEIAERKIGSYFAHRSKPPDELPGCA